MSKAWSARTAVEREVLEAAFVVRHGAEMLLDGDMDEGPMMDVATLSAPRRLPFTHLYAALQRPGALPSYVSEALRADPRLRDDFALLLRQHARHHVARAAAAADRGALRRREVGRCTIRVVESRASTDQVYLLVELPHSAPQPVAGSRRHRTHDAPGDDPTAEPSTVDAATPADPEHIAPRADGVRERWTHDSTTGAPAQLVVKTATQEFLKCDLPPPDAGTIRLVMAADDPVVQAVGEPASELFLW